MSLFVVFSSNFKIRSPFPFLKSHLSHYFPPPPPLALQPPPEGFLDSYSSCRLLDVWHRSLAETTAASARQCGEDGGCYKCSQHNWFKIFLVKDVGGNTIVSTIGIYDVIFIDFMA